MTARGDVDTSDAAIVADRCPLCGGGNACAMDVEHRTGVPQPPCWCVDARFDEALLARIPAAAHDVACVCVACAGEAPGTRC